MNQLRTIGSPHWLNEHTIAFSTPSGVYDFDVQTGKTRPVLPLEPEMSNAGMQSAVRILSANDEYLFTSRSSVIHLTTGREIPVPGLRRDREARNSRASSEFVTPGWISTVW